MTTVTTVIGTDTFVDLQHHNKQLKVWQKTFSLKFEFEVKRSLQHQTLSLFQGLLSNRV